MSIIRADRANLVRRDATVGDQSLQIFRGRAVRVQLDADFVRRVHLGVSGEHVRDALILGRPW